MSVHQAYRRAPVPAQVQQRSLPYIIPAPTRGIIMSENYTFMQPGAAIIQDNWVSTMRGVKLRGGCARWSVLPETTPIISCFEYISKNNQRMYVGNATKLYDVTTGGAPVEIKSGQTSGNYSASQLANAAGDFLTVVNDNGDFPLQFDGTTWTTFSADQIHTDPVKYPGAAVEHGKFLVYVWKYRNRYFFIEMNSMNAWYLPLNAKQGELLMIPLSGAATRGGKLLFGATWSVDAGDGIDDKCVFMTTEGEALIFTGSDPGNAATWRQEGRYQLSPPMGMNAHMPIAGDLLVATVDGIIPISQAITKTSEQLELAAITRTIKPMWRDEVADKNDWSWTMLHWDEYGGVFVTTPGGPPGKRYCLAVNAQTNAWCRFVGWDATCFMSTYGNMFFGTQGGIVMQADRGGTDDGMPYTALLVGGWEMFQSPPATVVWRQARAHFSSGAGEPFQPQLAACTDYVVRLPPIPPASPDPGAPDVWDQGLWAPDMGPPPPPVPTPIERDTYAQWDQLSTLSNPVVRNTLWVSIGETGFSHAPIVQVTVAQIAKPIVELISIAAVYDRCGINV